MTEPVRVDVENVSLSFGASKVLDNINVTITGRTGTGGIDRRVGPLGARLSISADRGG